MRKVVLAVVLFGACAANIWAADAFDEGVKLYEAKKYKECAAKLEDVLKKGRSSAELYYNLGNCYYQSGRKARAVWAYEKALRLDPRDADIRWNLDVVKKQVQDKREAGLSPEAWLVARLAPLRSDELAWAFSAMTALATALLLGFAFLPDHRLWLRRMAGPALLAFTLAAVCVWARWNDERRPAAIVSDKEVYVRYGPSEDSTRAFLLHEGSKVRVLKESGDWAFIDFGAKQRGWLPDSAVIRL